MILNDPKDYTEASCCFESTGKADSSPTRKTVPVPEIVARLDGLYDRGLESQALEYLSTWRSCARAWSDWRGEVSLLSELMGLHRRRGDAKAAMRAVSESLAIIKEHRMGETVSGATIMLNAATTMKAFGKAAESLPMFTQVCRVYAQKLDPTDYRFGGLYNNMALSYDDVGDLPMAEKYFNMAMTVIKTCPHPENELAVTLCNMAQMYGRRDMQDGRIGECLEKAWEYLDLPDTPRDGYYAFTASKCASAFDYFGYFIYAMKLRERAEKIYEGN